MVRKQPVNHRDERGFFRELIRVDDCFFEEGFGQISHSYVKKDVVKAWHYHIEQTDWWYVVTGKLHVALHDARTNSLTHGETRDFRMTAQTGVVKIPPGILHGYKCKTWTAHIIYVTSHVYNPNDEGRIDADDPRIGFDWDSV